MDEKIGRRSFLKTLAASAVLTLAFKKENEASTTSKNTPVKKDMPKKKFGSTGESIAVLQQGTSQVLNPVYDKVLHQCYREGVNVIDTALAYGWGASHSAIARFLEQIGNRKSVWITSKSGKGSTKGFIRDLDRCLKDLKTDYLDLYLMHGVQHTSSVNMNFARAGEKLKKSGKTKYFGLSTHTNSASVMRQAARVGGFDAILFRYSFRQFGNRELNLAIDECKKAGIGLIAMKTMSSIPSNEEKVVKFKSEKFTLGQAKLKSVWEDERIDTVVCEMTSIDEANENIAAAKSGIPLSAGEVHQLNRLAAITAGSYCSGCSSMCESRIEGDTRISDILRFMMYHDSYGKVEQARRLYNEMPLRFRSFSRADILNARKACPQGIDIASLLQRAERVLS